MVKLSAYCDEFLVHGVDVEGRLTFIEFKLSVCCCCFLILCLFFYVRKAMWNRRTACDLVGRTLSDPRWNYFLNKHMLRKLPVTKFIVTYAGGIRSIEVI